MRIKVAAVGNVFFDISNNNFTIKDGFPPFTVDVNATSVMLCALDTLSFYVSAKTLDLTPDTILVSTFNTIQGIKVLFSNDTLYTEDSILVTIINNNSAAGRLPQIRTIYIHTKSVWLPFSNLTLVQRNPSPDLLYMQNDFVDDGTFEKMVSIYTVSAEKVSCLPIEAEKLSFSLQADKQCQRCHHR